MKKTILTYISILLLGIPAMSADTENAVSADEAAADKLSISGFIETVDYYGTDGKYNNEDDEEFVLSKFEAHGKLDARYDFNSMYSLRSVIFGHAYTSMSPVLRDFYEDKNIVNVQELYFSALFSSIDFQAGIQRIKWGTANTINPTSYFNQFDLTEVLLKDSDELYIGIPALAANIMADDISLKLVYVPVHTPTRLPERGGPWSLRMPDQKMTNPFGPGEISIPVETAGIKNDPYFNYDRHGADDYSAGAKLSSTVSGIDLSLSGYHGYDRDIVLLPGVVVNPADPFDVIVELTPGYYRITSAGADFAFSISDFTIYGEGTYTFNKPAVTESMSPQVERSGYIYSVLGFNWLYDENFKIIVEYLKGAYTKETSMMFIEKNSRYVDPFFSDLLSGSIEKKFFESSLVLEIKGIYNTKKHDGMIMPKAGWKFDGNFLVEAGLTLFSGESDTLFGSYSDRDVVNFKVKYYF